MTDITRPYRGRFAPTPSGPLHLGSLLTALASWLSARSVQGGWWLRVDDLDQPRCVAGAEDTILRQLEAHGLYWDGRPVLQTEHEQEYRSVLLQLQTSGTLYPCVCTRAVLTTTARQGPDGPIYAGTCRDARISSPDSALRFRTAPSEVVWLDGIQGMVRRQLPAESGDFVLRRADGRIGYHLACALDEHRMGITDVLRGADLLGSTVQQLQLMQTLGLAAPRYAHLPVLQAADGRKLSKQNGAPALATDASAVAQQLRFCLSVLGLTLPLELSSAPATDILDWALPQWQHCALQDLRGVVTPNSLP